MLSLLLCTATLLKSVVIFTMNCRTWLSQAASRPLVPNVVLHRRRTYLDGRGCCSFPCKCHRQWSTVHVRMAGCIGRRVEESEHCNLCVCVCVCACVCVRVCAYVRACVCVCMRACKCVCVCACVCTCSVCMCVCAYVCASMCVCLKGPSGWINSS